jgi:hypothetical protein
VHMVFKFLSTLVFRTWKPMCANTYGFQALFNSGFPRLETMCASTYGFQALSNFRFPSLKTMCASAYGFQALFNFGFSTLKTICIGFLNLKTHVCLRVWCSRCFQF